MDDLMINGKEYEVVIGLEVHAEMATRSKMFCACQVVDSTQAPPNTAVCPVCEGLPGALPVVNQQAVEYAMRVALALECNIAHTSLFARKNYFYPDLPKGYQISQFEDPLAEHGRLAIHTSQGEKTIRIRRTHLEEDAGKLTHITHDRQSYSLVDLNRAGVPLLEIVSEPDMRSAEEARAYGQELRAILRYLDANSGNMEKGVIRFEANVSLKPVDSDRLGTRTEIKNLNSFRSLERGIEYEIKRQKAILETGEIIRQETLGWDENKGQTYSQRSKEDAHDYRYFPEPDLPPLVIKKEWITHVAAGIPELPQSKAKRFQDQFGLSSVDARVLVAEQAVADYFEGCLAADSHLKARSVANWITGEVFAWMNHNGLTINKLKVDPPALAELLAFVESSKINQNTAKNVLAEMLESGQSAAKIIEMRALQQISDTGSIVPLVQQVLEQNPGEVENYLNGKETLANWFFGQVMRLARGKANPQVVRDELERQLHDLTN